MFFSKRWNPDGSHCYVPGGSQGLGLSLAKLLVEKGANVSVVARTQSKLDKALVELEAVRQNPNQKLRVYSYSLATAKESEEALHAVCDPYGGLAPDAIFNCAGAAHPLLVVDMTEEDIISGFTDGYWVQAWTAFAAFRLMAKQKRKGKIVLCSSTLGIISLIGWASYGPAKHAVKGLADTLQHEGLLYGIDVHTFFPPTMPTPGLDEENKRKPEITKKTEEGEPPVSPEDAAATLLKGVAKGHIHITGTFEAEILRASTRGSTYRNNWVVDVFLDFIAFIAQPIWRAGVDRQVLAHREEHEKYLLAKGFYTTSS